MVQAQHIPGQEGQPEIPGPANSLKLPTRPNEGSSASQLVESPDDSPRKRRRTAHTKESLSFEAERDENSRYGYEAMPDDLRRVPGVHQTTALFRSPTELSKKYARPPMSKIFTSLEISTENFLRLQAAAKAYMLDDDHPERRESVGQKGKSEDTLVKLKLLKCVEEFLDDLGWGEEVFGTEAVNKGVEERTYFWPKDRDRIIQQVTPLLRRMVTNERQRLYANETRKAQKGTDTEPANEAPPKKLITDTDDLRGISTTTTLFDPRPSFPFTPESLVPLFTDSPLPPLGEASAFYTHYDTVSSNNISALHTTTTLADDEWFNIIAAIDGHFRLFHKDGNSCPPACEEAHLNHLMSTYSPIQRDQSSQEGTPTGPEAVKGAWDIIRDTNQGEGSSLTPPACPISIVTLQIYTYTKNRSALLIRPRLDLQVSDYPTLKSLKQKILASLAESKHHLEADTEDLEVTVLLHTGLYVLTDEETEEEEEKSWATAVEHAAIIGWMEGVLKVIVEVGQGD